MAASGKGQIAVSAPITPKATVEIKAFREGAVIPKKQLKAQQDMIFVLGLKIHLKKHFSFLLIQL